MKKLFILCFVLTFWFNGIAAAASAESLMLLSDNADMISEQEELELETILKALKEQTSIEFSIVTVDSLNGRTIEGTAYDTFRTMGMGKKEDGKRLLLLISYSEHQFRLEVGYSLEEIISEAATSGVGNSMLSYFEKEDYYGGIRQAISGVVYYLKESKEYKLSIDKDYGLTYKEEKDGNPIAAVHIFLIITLVIIVYMIIDNWRTRRKKGAKGKKSGGVSFGKGAGGSIKGRVSGGGFKGGPSGRKSRRW